MDNQATFDMIVGRDFLVALGIDISHEKREVQWQGLSIPFRSRNNFEPFEDEVLDVTSDLEITVVNPITDL